jgi:hypothetical protein
VVASLAANSVSVKNENTQGGKGRRLVSFTIRSDTKITRGGQQCALADIKPGEPIAVEFSSKPGSSLRRVTEIQVGQSSTTP